MAPSFAYGIRFTLLLLVFKTVMCAHSVYFGNYADSLRVADFDSATGVLSGERPAVDLARASFLTKSKDGRFLYAVSEVAGGSLHAFGINPDGKLSRLNSVASGGAGPCALALSPDGRWLAAANYGGGSVIMYRVEADGRLGERAGFFQHTHATDVFPGRQKRAHAHGVAWSPDGRRLHVPDLGADRVYVYVQGADGFSPHPGQPWLELPPGSGPRHALCSPDGLYLYVINELANTVGVAVSLAGGDSWELVQTISTLPAGGFAGPTKTAEIALHPAGHTLYASNRGADTLALFHRDRATGRLVAAGHVAVPPVPRHFSLSPDGRWLLSAGQDSDVVAVFAVDATTGALTRVNDAFKTPKPVCVRF